MTYVPADPSAPQPDASEPQVIDNASSSPPDSPTAKSSRGRLDYLEEMVAVATAVNATLDLEKVLNLLVEKALELLHVPAASVVLVEDGQQVRLRAAKGLSAAYVESQRRPLEGSISGRALTEGRIFAAWDIRQSADPATAGAAAREGIVSVACAPMFAAGRPVGALNLYCRDPYCFSEDQFHVLSLLAAQGAIAVTNARLYRQSRAHAAEIRASFQRVGAALASSLDSGQTLKLIVQLAGEMTRAEGGAMFMPDGDGEHERGELFLAAARGLHRRSIRLFRRVRLSSLAARALNERKVVVVTDTRRHPDVPFPSLRHAAPDGAEAEPRPVRSAVYVPVIVGERPVGILEQYAAEPNHFDRNDVQLLESFALQAAVAIENARLYAQEHKVVQTLQQAFLPELPDSVSGFQIGRIYAAANEAAAVGGDTYDLFKLPDGRIAVLMADVCGKGTYAATLTVMAKYTARAYALEDPEPPRVLARLNDALYAQTDDFTFLTVCYALLDPASRQVRVACAAHPPALFCRTRERVCAPLSNEPGVMAGIRVGEEYASVADVFQTGDILVLYTDGVTEARKRKTLFEVDRLCRVVEANRTSSAQEIAAAIYDAVLTYTGGNLTDDIALLVLKAQ